MADDVGRFVVGIDADPSGLAAGLQASADQISHFADVASTDIARANAAIGATAPLNAQSLQIATLIAQHRELARTIEIEGAQTATTFRESSDALASQLVKMGATEKELDNLGRSVKTVEQRYIAMAVAATAASQAQNGGRQFLQTGTLSIPTVNPGQVAGIAGAATQLGNIAASSAAAGINLTRLRLPLTTIADHALGASRSFGTLSSGLLSIGLGAGPTIALIAGVAALALAYDAATESSRKAKEKLDALIKSMDEAALKRVDVVVTLSLDTASLEKEQRRLQQEAASLQQSISTASLTAATGVAGVGGGADAFAGKDRENALKRLGEVTKALAEIQAQVGDQNIKITNESVSSLAQLIKGQTASNRERQVGLDLLTQNKDLLTALNATQEGFAAAGTLQSAKQIADLQARRVAVQRNVTELTDAFKVKPDNSLEKFLTDLQKRSTDVVSALKLIADATKGGQHLPVADFSAVPLAAVNAYDDALRKLTKNIKDHNLTLDQQIRLTEVLQRLQGTTAVIIDEARKKFGDASNLVIPPVPLTFVVDETFGNFAAKIADLAKEHHTIPLGLNLVLPGAADFDAILATFNEHVREASGAKLDLEVALQLGDSGKGIVDTIRTSAAEALKKAQSDAAFVIQSLPSSGLSPEDQIKVLQRLKKELGDVAAIAKEARPPDLGLQEFIVAGRGIVSIADSFGHISDSARKMTTGILDAAEALHTFNKAKADGDALGELGSIVGIAGGIASLVGGIAGLFHSGNAEQRKIQDEANRVLADNSRHLEELGVKIAGWIGSIPDLQKVSIAVNAGGSDAVLQHIRDLANQDTALAGANHTVEPNRAAFDAFLKGTGISLAQLEAAAHQVGISLYDQAGRIIPGAFAQLQDAIRLTIIDMTQFQNTLSDQRSLADLNANVFDLKQSPIDIVDSWLDTFKKIAPAGFAQIFGSVDPHNAAAVKKAEQDFVTAVENGTIDLAKLGITKDDFIAIITGMETGFDSATSAANALSQSLRNVPEGFKVAAFEFAAAAVEARRSVASAPTSPGPGSTPTIPVTRSPAGPPPVNASFTLDVAEGAIVVYAAPGDDPKKTAAAVFSQLRIIAGTTGDDVIRRFVASLPR